MEHAFTFGAERAEDETNERMLTKIEGKILARNLVRWLPEDTIIDPELDKQGDLMWQRITEKMRADPAWSWALVEDILQNRLTFNTSK